MRQSKLLSLLLAVLTALAVLAGAVAVPILCRPFYYAQIGPLGLEAYTGLTEDQIRQAYDEVLDYCTGLTEEFSAGVLPFSDSGASHFADVRGLFLLDLGALAGSLIALAAVILLCRRRVRPQPLLGRGPGFWAGTGAAAAVLLGGLRPGGGLPGRRRLGRPGLQPGLHRLSRPVLPGQDQLDLRLAHRPGHPDPPPGLLPQLRPAGAGPHPALVRRPHRRRPAGRGREKESRSVRWREQRAE